MSELPPICFKTFIAAPASRVFEVLTTARGWGEALTLLKVFIEHGIDYGPVPPA